jgi:hypothetical protein
MPTKVYETSEIELIDGKVLEISPLKIKYLREFMEYFNLLNDSMNDEQSLAVLTKCVVVSMKQYYPEIATIELVEDNIDLPTIYQIIEYAGGIKINKGAQIENNPISNQPKEKDNSWDNLDLVKLESELFALGAWKNFDEIESNLSMPELMAILESMRELDYNEKKFLAAMQGVDLDEAGGRSGSEPDPWEAMKARVASNGATSDPNDILSYQGQRAAKAGFGIGMGLDYEVITN